MKLLLEMADSDTFENVLTTSDVTQTRVPSTNV